MDKQTADFADWLMSRVGHPLIIRKEEQGDVDQVRMTLEKVAYVPGNVDRDDYVEEDRLVLHGDGQVATDGGGGAAELPRHSYEIPLQSGFQGSIENDELTLRTERASYRVYPQ
ncbi:hypothetical protein MO973_24930 [Paenibacillus sp. TRM 82003]|nr:hypothetical protein [Paenibacillus sp. TRM 82003]MCI3923477.1 hypothetical protein [Paenibacillus sp. TRM 82003]